jgi:hypothetical protein
VPNQDPEVNQAQLGLAELIRRLSAGGAASADPSAAAGGLSPGAAFVGFDVLRFMGLAWFACLTSGLRSWSRAAEMLSRELPSLARAVGEVPSGPGSPEAHAVLLDEIKGRFREFMEIPGEESRALQVELEKIVAAIWPSASPTAEGPYWRRWEAKP